MELEDARVLAGISITEFSSMPGSHIWLKSNQHMCKADLLVWYRMTRYTDGVLEDIKSNKMRAAQAKARAMQGSAKGGRWK